MPTYEYECKNCEHEFETMHSILKKALKKCPKCNKNQLIRLISGGGAVIIKGTQTPCTGGMTKQERKEEKSFRKKQKRKAKKKANEALKKNPPFWRSSKDGQPRQDILKNPQKYIETGEID